MTTNARQITTSVAKSAATPTSKAEAKPMSAKHVAITFAGMAEHSFAQKTNPFITSNILIETIQL
jgi:hypothetical protein